MRALPKYLVGVAIERGGKSRRIRVVASQQQTSIAQLHSIRLFSIHRLGRFRLGRCSLLSIFHSRFFFGRACTSSLLVGSVFGFGAVGFTAAVRHDNGASRYGDNSAPGTFEEGPQVLRFRRVPEDQFLKYAPSLRNIN